MTMLISIDGVLRTEVGDPIPQGLKLYSALLASGRVVLSTDGNKAAAEHWLRTQLVSGYGDLLANDSAFEGEDLKVRHLKLLQSQGRIVLFVDPDVDRCKAAVQMGITTLLFASPKFVRTKRQIKPWNELTDELQKQKDLVAKIVLDGPLDRWE
jgi:hypothetical protein